MNRTRKTFVQALLAGTALSQPCLVRAVELPHGATTVYGGVTVATPSANQMTIQQSTQTAIVNWQGFSVGAGGRVDINQPSSSSAILNRVTGSTTSTIAGQINANGQVYLVNPNGIAITPTGTIQAGAFVASTLDISDQDFASGKRVFRGTGQSATVSNQGTIAIQRGGYAALLGGKVENSGLISVPMGRVGLGAGEQATLDFSGDGFLQVAIPSKSDGSDKALIQHSGRISATGGQVVMQVATARDAARNAINLSGIVEARSISGRNGAIVLGGGEGGTVTVSGRLDTSARSVAAGSHRAAAQTAARGGDITVTGDAIRLQGAKLLADGQAGGGAIRVGGGFQGQGSLQRASTTLVDAATTISANAGRSGNGGDIVIWSDHRTDFMGMISATGGFAGGNGGQAEVSSKGVLAYDGTTILTAAKGSFGTLLLDPYNLTISNGSAIQGDYTASANDSVISATSVQTILQTANLTLSTGGANGGSQQGNITVAAPLTWGTGTGGQQTTLTLNAYNSIFVNATMRVNGNGGLVLNYGRGSGGTLIFGSSANVSYINGGGQGQALTINNQPYTLITNTTNFNTLFVNGNPAGYYALAADIDATGFTLPSPIGTTTAFTGTLEGLGHAVSNLSVNNGGSLYAGLFGHTVGATIENLRLDNINVNSTYSVSNTPGFYTGTSYVGGLVGLADNTTINGVSVSGTVRGSSIQSNLREAYTGGLAGSLNGGNVRNSTSSVAVTGGAALQTGAGGLIGLNNGTISSSSASGAVTGGNAVVAGAGLNNGSFSATGGLVGVNSSSGHITQAFATNSVTGGYGGGGGLRSATGGLVGYNDGEIFQAYASGAVVGGSRNNATDNDSTTGGLVGESRAGSVKEAYASGNVTAGGGYDSYAGGLIGTNDAVVQDAYSTGNVNGSSIVNNGNNFTGGLIGFNSSYSNSVGNVNRTYATGAVTGGSRGTLSTGGLIGGNQYAVSNSFWDTQSTGQTSSAGANSGTIDAVGLNTADFQNRNNFINLAQPKGWNFQTTWAPPSPGYYPQLYSINPVLDVVANPQSRNAGDGNPPLTGTVYGGPGVYVFAPPGSGQLPASSVLATTATSATGSGAASIDPISSITVGGVTYRVTGQSSTLTINPGPDTGGGGGGGGGTNPPQQPTGTQLVQAGFTSARVTPNIVSILPNVFTASLTLADSLDLAGGGGPTLGIGQGSTLGGSDTQAGAQTALASIQRASNNLEEKIAACDSRSNSASRGVANCYSNALDGFADSLDIQVQQLPPAFRGLPAVIRQAAQRVRAARTVAEARAAVAVAVVAVRKAISLLRADEPAVARIQVRQGNAIASALRTVDNRLSRAVGL